MEVEGIIMIADVVSAPDHRNVTGRVVVVSKRKTVTVTLLPVAEWIVSIEKSDSCYSQGAMDGLPQVLPMEVLITMHSIWYTIVYTCIWPTV